MKLNEISEIISQSTTIGITFHTSPDGDSIGSALALLISLEKLNKNVYIICKEKLPVDFSFLPRSEAIDGTIQAPKEGTEIVIVIDCGNVERVNADLSNYKKTIINVDHHISNDQYGHYNYIDTSAAASAEIIFNLIKDLGAPFDSKIASCIYTSIMTDTGSFKYSNTTSNTHLILSELLKYPFDFTLIHRLIYENKDQKYIKLLGLVYSDMKLVRDSKICLFSITDRMLKELNFQLEDSSEIVSSGLMIKGVEASILFKEKNDGVKISFRSKDKIDVRKIAEYFSGGGHIKASGAFISNVTIDKATEMVLAVIEENDLC
ncbi:DHH family phosphoesterase [Alloiococcus sp. CFN-8]|uniref:DHH family phosphoesterase n=1 Tax=Alloiococcus sp. CFN-8 TaxID=3416081 RepID=UPI003CE9A99F